MIAFRFETLVVSLKMVGVAFSSHWRVSLFREHKINLSNKAFIIYLVDGKGVPVLSLFMSFNHHNPRIFLWIISIVIKYFIH